MECLRHLPGSRLACILVSRCHRSLPQRLHLLLLSPQYHLSIANMSNSPLQPEVLSQHVSLRTATTLRPRFCSFSVEILVRVLCTTTAAELTNFRCCCMAFDALFIANESAVIGSILNNHFYHTASKFYDVVFTPGPLRFGCLKHIACRCYIADILATSIEEHRVGHGLATTTRIGTETGPYLLSLGHIFEIYRKAPANYTSSPSYAPSVRSYSAKMAGEILKAIYNEKTVQPICLMYKHLNQIIDQKFIGRELTIWYPLPVARTPPGTIDNFTFGGLEMVKDIVTHPRWYDRLKYIASHFSKTTTAPIPRVNGEPLAVAIPSSVLGHRLNTATSHRICNLLSVYSPILQIRSIEVFGFPRVEPAEELDMSRDFLEHLKSYNGEEPKLVL